MRFVLASGNAHKLAEYRAILSPHDVEPMPAGIELPPEGVTSFEDNARGKAEALARALAGLDRSAGAAGSAARAPLAGAAPPAGTGTQETAAAPPFVVIADDSGIEVAALGGAPGVTSARYAGREGDDAANNRRLLAELAALAEQAVQAGAPGGLDRAARFVCVIAFVVDGVAGSQAVRGEWPGAIAAAPHGAAGFGYDPLFVPAGQRVTVAEMSEADKNLQSHRARAARALLARLAAGPPP
jgi:XTP/dITP diphosphohydrolase